MADNSLNWLITEENILRYRVVGYRLFWQHKARPRLFGKGGDPIRNCSEETVAAFIRGMNKCTPEIHHWFEPVLKPVRRAE